MREIDRLGWAGGFVVKMLGVRIGVRATDLDTLTLLERAFSNKEWSLEATPQDEIVDYLLSLRVGPPPTRKRKSFHVLYSGAARISRSLDLDVVVARLLEVVPEIARARCKDAVFIPGCVLKRDGVSLVIPMVGFGEKACGLVSSFPKELDVLEPVSFGVSLSDQLVNDFGENLLRFEDESLMFCLVLLDSGAQEKKVTSLSPGEAMMRILELGVAPGIDKSLAVTCLRPLLTHATCFFLKCRAVELSDVLMTLSDVDREG